MMKVAIENGYIIKKGQEKEVYKEKGQKKGQT